MFCTTEELRDKDVINVCSGRNLGKVAELELDTESGCVSALIVCPDSLSSLFSSRNHVRVPWNEIKCIGRDTVLVEIPVSLESGEGKSSFFGKKRSKH
ncbi:MAG: YlmC/YmxH family sporulation protein [Clostridia bacterium]|nr:YlmC/YmxH family sporulation protein [Clostridia bacterium]